MRRKVLLAVLALTLVVPVLAQDTPEAGGVCCVPPGGGAAQHWAQLRTCPNGWTPVPLAECGIVQPTPVPTEVPTPVPTVVPPDPPYVPKDVAVPTYVQWVMNLAASWYGKTLILPAGIMAILIWLTELLKTMAPRLRGRWAYACTATISALGVLASLAADLKLEKGEWWPALFALLGIVAAALGYRLTTGKLIARASSGRK